MRALPEEAAAEGGPGWSHSPGRGFNDAINVDAFRATWNDAKKLTFTIMGESSRCEVDVVTKDEKARVGVKNLEKTWIRRAGAPREVEQKRRSRQR